ncbi:hypothetical protein [Desulfoluna spongiiphila]|uniref:DUF4468 domain-containing protein n=1 Tax=Desulfoluna spongiiphila TaxID=419481 RepID=A0A1G5BLP6_9BACT|nr:hypothetical protein [Desulfoluna spongiiphila]SCX91122.1 hypothetical protein SAMN05216233_10286 [Desulfoluna spongiiphila]
MRIFLITILVLFSVNVNADVVERPNQKYPDQALKSYSWLVGYKKCTFSVFVNDDAKRFMNEESMKRYFKLKMRNFVRDVELVDNPKDNNHNYLYFNLELYRYNDKTKIYYGLVSLKLDSSVNFSGSDARIYELTTSIAGSESQLIGFIKQEIDLMVEVYAEDYYYLYDLNSKHNKRVN